MYVEGIKFSTKKMGKRRKYKKQRGGFFGALPMIMSQMGLGRKKSKQKKTKQKGGQIFRNKRTLRLRWQKQRGGFFGRFIEKQFIPKEDRLWK